MDAFVSVELEAKCAQPAINGEKNCNGSQLELGEPGLRLEGAGLMSSSGLALSGLEPGLKGYSLIFVLNFSEKLD